MLYNEGTALMDGDDEMERALKVAVKSLIVLLCCRFDGMVVKESGHETG